MRYTISEKSADIEALYVLRDEEAQAEAIIVPGIGNQVIHFETGGINVLFAPPSLTELREKPTRYGVPVLSPPNRVREGTFRFQDRSYTLPNDGRSPHHIHGEIGKKPWKVAEQGSSEEQGAYLTTQFCYEEHPDILGYFPHELIFEFTYRLKDGRLTLEGNVVNTGSTKAPLAIGFHPYFNLPGGLDATVVIPAIAEWQIAEDLFTEGSPEATAMSQQVAEGLAVRDIPYADYGLFTMPQRTNRSEIIAVDGQSRIIYETDEQLPFMVLFKPSWGEAVSLEPYSCVTDAFNVELPGETTGAQGLEASATFSFKWSLYVE